jgi:Concanavalin A-like lectin/glucanases superfamily
MATYSDRVLSKDPVGYWRLGETAAPTATDTSGSGNDGVYHGTPAFGQTGAIAHDPDPAIGLHGPASEDYVEISNPTSALFSQPTSGLGLTIEVWLRPDVLTFAGQTGHPYIHWLGKGTPGHYEWGMRFYSRNTDRPNRISAYLWNPQGGEGAGAYFEDELTVGAWMHIVVCYEPGDQHTDPPAGVHIYRDGVHRLGPPSPGTLYRNFNITAACDSAPVRLGTRDCASFLTGGLDEVAIYPRVLTPDEILDNYHGAQRPSTERERD